MSFQKKKTLTIFIYSFIIFFVLTLFERFFFGEIEGFGLGVAVVITIIMIGKTKKMA